MSTSRTRPLSASGLALLTTLLLLLSTNSAQAQDPKEVVTDDVDAAISATDKKASGWDTALSVGATGSFNHSSKVVGAVDGMTMQVGLLLKGAANLIVGSHEWQNTLGVDHAQTKTPLLESFAKSADNLEVKSLYLYRSASVPWVGPFARARMKTAIFPGYDLRPDGVVVLRTDRDGNITTTALPAQEEISLTDGFEPLTVVLSTGAFVEPIKEKIFTLNSKLGVGSQHIFVQDGFVLTDNGDTPELELSQLSTSHSAGAEFELELLGQAVENVTWNVLTNVFYPVVTSAETDLEGMDLMHVDISAKLSVKLAKWLSFDYVLSAKKQPFVLDAWQVQNQALFTAGFNLL